MAILRAGPFASSTDSFLDEPVTPTSAIIPVNCGKVSWVFDNFKHFLRVDQDSVLSETYEIGLPNTNVAGVSAADIIADYYYQASSSFIITIQYSSVAVNDSEQDGVSAEFNVYINGQLEFSDSDGSLGREASVSGTENITLPASVVPTKVRLEINTTANGDGTSPADEASGSITVT